MSANDVPYVTDAEVTLVSDRRYPKVLGNLLRRAGQRIWASLFIVDLDPDADRKHAVFDMLVELAAARWRGADVRLIVSGSRENLAMAESAATTVAIARQIGVSTRWLGVRPRRGSHAKFVIADDEMLLGSHNWSASAFLLSTQDSLLIRSPALARYLGGLFAAQWQRKEARTRL
jgi:phosphatidylserine/phosphatidylglycerophosphate/cardiolipin synthase-like enzyme